MVKKIKKKVKTGPKGTYAIPMVMAMTCLYGSRLEGKDFDQTFEAPEQVRAVLLKQFGQGVLVSDRVLSSKEYVEWGLKTSPGRLVQLFYRSGIIPMGPSLNRRETNEQPRLGILFFIVLVKGKHLERFGDEATREFSEVTRVAFQNSLQSCFRLIPGYDHFLYTPPYAARDLNPSIASLNQFMEASYDQSDSSFPGPFKLLEEELLSKIPSQEACSVQAGIV